MNHKIISLKNGLKLLTVPMPSLESATVTVWARTGSRNEKDNELGVSHFLEHMAFKGGKKYKTAKDVSQAIDAIGGEFNASTSKEWTQYYVKAHKDKIEVAFDVLSDMILNPALRDSDINREKGVIIEEMRMYEDTPIRRIWDRFEQLIFNGTVLGNDIIGNQKTVKSFNRSNFKNYMSKHYYGENMLVTVAGGIKVDDIEKYTKRYFDRLKKSGTGKIGSLKIEQSKPKVKLHYKDIEQAHFILGFLSDKMGEQSRYEDTVLNSVLGGGMSSRLFTEVREKRGLAYSVRSDFERFLDCGYFSVYAGTDPKKAPEAIKVIQDQVYEFGLKHKLNVSEFNKAKGYLKGHLALGLEDTSDVNYFFGLEYLMLGRVRTPDEVFKNIDKVDLDSVTGRAKKVFNPKGVNLAVIGPYKGSRNFEKLMI